MSENKALEKAKKDYDIAISKAQKALSQNPIDYKGYVSAMSDLDEAEKSYASLVSCELYAEYAKKENPLVEIIKVYSYDTIGHKEVRDKNNHARIETIEPVTKSKPIDLLAFCKRARIDVTWSNYVSCFNQLMCLRTAKNLGVDVKQLAKTYYLSDKVKQIELGETPTSNTQVCKLLQKVIDNILPNEDENGNVIYKVNNYDVAYLDAVYGKKSNKSILTVRVSNDSFLRRILVDIMYRVITNSKYNVDGFKVIEA